VVVIVEYIHSWPPEFTYQSKNRRVVFNPFDEFAGVGSVTKVGEFAPHACLEIGHFLKVNQGKSKLIKAKKGRERV
jgi:hypothetical protein